MAELVNRVKSSKLVTLDLESWVDPQNMQELDLAEWLHMGLVVREAEFRQALESIEEGAYAGRVVWVHCSTDAIIPKWAWILPALRLDGIARAVHIAQDHQSAVQSELLRLTAEHDWEAYQGRFVILKGCSRIDIPEAVYADAAVRLSRHAAKILYGEACSHVPLFRSPVARSAASPSPAD